QTGGAGSAGDEPRRGTPAGARALRRSDGERGPGRGDDRLPRETRAPLPGQVSVSRVGVLGAGTMGRGIAQLAALGGYETVLYDVAPELAEGGAAALRGALDKGAERGRWSVDDAKAAAARVETTA